jgi:hypothetical protein
VLTGNEKLQNLLFVYAKAFCIMDMIIDIYETKIEQNKIKIVKIQNSQNS